MKNILAENMLRFGSKNLDAKSVKKLQKLAEQVPLTGAERAHDGSVLKTVGSEEKAYGQRLKTLGIAEKIIGMLMKSINRPDTDEQMILDALKLITSKEIYQRIIELFRISRYDETGRLWISFNGKEPPFYTIASVIQPDFYKRSTSSDISGDKAWINQYEKLLTKWNPKEQFPWISDRD